MFNIADYLKKFALIEGNSNLQKEAIAVALKEICGIDGIKTEIRKGVIFVKASPASRSAIFIKKAALLDFIKEKYPKAGLYDIR